MKKLFCLVVSVLLLAVSVNYAAAQTKEEVTALVEQTKVDFEKNAFQTMAKINKGDHPYKDIDNPSL